MGYNTYGKKEVGKGRVPVQVWAEIRGAKHGGGTIDATAFADYAVGAVIPAGTPIHLDKSGGTATPIYTYEVLEDVGSADTEVILKGVFPLTATGFLMVAPNAIGGQGKGVAYTGGKYEDEGAFVQSVQIAADALGELSAGTILMVADKAHASGSVPVNDKAPTGLLYHDITKRDGDQWASAGVVDRGRIFEDRVVGGIPASFKTALPGISFEKGI